MDPAKVNKVTPRRDVRSSESPARDTHGANLGSALVSRFPHLPLTILATGSFVIMVIS